MAGRRSNSDRNDGRNRGGALGPAAALWPASIPGAMRRPRRDRTPTNRPAEERSGTSDERSRDAGRFGAREHGSAVAVTVGTYAMDWMRRCRRRYDPDVRPPAGGLAVPVKLALVPVDRRRLHAVFPGQPEGEMVKSARPRAIGAEPFITTIADKHQPGIVVRIVRGIASALHDFATGHRSEAKA